MMLSMFFSELQQNAKDYTEVSLWAIFSVTMSSLALPLKTFLNWASSFDFNNAMNSLSLVTFISVR